MLDTTYSKRNKTHTNGMACILQERINGNDFNRNRILEIVDMINNSHNEVTKAYRVRKLEGKMKDIALEDEVSKELMYW